MTTHGLAVSGVRGGEQGMLLDPASSTRFSWFDIDQQPRAWDEAVRSAGQGVFHLSQVLAVNASRGAKRRGIVVDNGDATLAVVGGLWSDGSAGASFRTLSFQPQAAQAQGVLPALIAWLHRQGIADVHIGSYDGGVEQYGSPTGAWLLEERLEFLWRLDQPAAERIRGLHSGHRRKLKSLLRRELRMREVARLRPELMTLLRVRWAQRRGRRLSWRKIAGIYSYYRRLEARLTRTGLAKLYGLYDERDRALSIAYMLETSQAAFYMIGASSPAGYRVGASVRLFYELAGHYAGGGLRYLNLGGVPAGAAVDGHDEHGVYRFKSDFGIEPERRTSLVYREPPTYQQEPQGSANHGDTDSVPA